MNKQQSKLDLLEEILPDISVFLTKVLAKEPLSAEAERKRQFYVRKLEQLKVVSEVRPSLPDRRNDAPTATTSSAPTASQPPALPGRNTTAETRLKASDVPPSLPDRRPEAPKPADLQASVDKHDETDVYQSNECYDEIEIKKATAKNKRTDKAETSSLQSPSQHSVDSGEDTDYEFYSDEEYVDKDLYEDPNTRPTALTTKKCRKNPSKFAGIPRKVSITSQELDATFPDSTFCGFLFQQFKVGPIVKKSRLVGVLRGTVLQLYKSHREKQPARSLTMPSFISVTCGATTDRAGALSYMLRLLKGDGASETLLYVESKKDADRWLTELQQVCGSKLTRSTGSVESSAQPTEEYENPDVITQIINNGQVNNNNNNKSPQPSPVLQEQQPENDYESTAAAVLTPSNNNTPNNSTTSTLTRRKKEATDKPETDAASHVSTKDKYKSGIMNGIGGLKSFAKSTFSRNKGKLAAKEIKEKLLDDPSADISGKLEISLDFEGDSPTWSWKYCVVKEGSLLMYNDQTDEKPQLRMFLHETEIYYEKFTKGQLVIPLKNYRDSICLQFNDNALHGYWMSIVANKCKHPSQSSSKSTEDAEEYANSSEFGGSQTTSDQHNYVDVITDDEHYLSMTRGQQIATKSANIKLQSAAVSSKQQGAADRSKGSITPADDDKEAYENMDDLDLPPPVPKCPPPPESPAGFHANDNCESDDDDTYCEPNESFGRQMPRSMQSTAAGRLRNDDDQLYENDSTFKSKSETVVEKRAQLKVISTARLPMTTLTSSSSRQPAAATLRPNNELKMVEDKKVVQDRIKKFQSN